MSGLLLDLVRCDRTGAAVGIASVCSARLRAIEAVVPTRSTEVRRN
jgi:tagatose-1,6-bisphosphate aldolase non-catalytic subunit AgaZ/GatZ